MQRVLYRAVTGAATGLVVLYSHRLDLMLLELFNGSIL